MVDRSVGRSVIGRSAGRLVSPPLPADEVRHATAVNSPLFFLDPVECVCVPRRRCLQESKRALSLRSLREDEEAEVHKLRERRTIGVPSLALLAFILVLFCFVFAPTACLLLVYPFVLVARRCALSAAVVDWV